MVFQEMWAADPSALGWSRGQRSWRQRWAKPQVTTSQSGASGPPTLNGMPPSGFSLVGGTRVEGGPEPGPGAPTVYIRAFSLVGGVRIQRSGRHGDRGPRGAWRAEREDWRAERRDWRAERRAERRSRRGRPG